MIIKCKACKEDFDQRRKSMIYCYNCSDNRTRIKRFRELENKYLEETKKQYLIKRNLKTQQES